VLGSYRGEELGLHNRISEAADPLHFGYFGGLTTKIIWFFLGIFMTALSITGFMIYGARLGKIALSSKGRKINNDSESEEDIQFS
jgi:uncharacterized iron-regulated membrane protein